MKFVLDVADASTSASVQPRRRHLRRSPARTPTTKNALLNWGIGAIVYLVVGRFLERHRSAPRAR